MSPPTSDWSRRGFLAGCGVGIGGVLGWLSRRTGAARGSGLLRPPGASSEEEFLAACIRCGQCVAACPEGTLILAGPGQALSAGTPFVTAREVPCNLCQGHDDLLCIAACPTLALQPVPDYAEIEMGVAVIDRTACLAWNRTVCRACWHACPFPNEAIVLDPRGRVEIVAEACIGCGLCDHVCLTEPSSITIIPEHDWHDGDPTFTGEGTT